MANYLKSTNFAVKDALSTGNPDKRIKGTEIDTEFNSLATAIQSKADTASPTFTGTPAAPTAAGGTNTTQLATTAFVASAVSTATAALGTMSTQDNTAVDIEGGTIDATVIGGTTPAAGSFTTINASGTITGNVTGNVTGNLTGDVTGNLTGNVTGTATSLSTTSGAAPSYSARAWVNFKGTGTVSIKASGNVSSITDNGAGDYTVNYTSAMPDANYAVNGFGVAYSVGNVSGTSIVTWYPNGTGTYVPLTKTTTQSRIYTGNSNSGVPTDCADISFAVFR